MNNKYWDAVAAGYDEHLKKSEVAYSKAIELIKSDLCADATILDIGTGTGEIPFAIAGGASKIVAIDTSSKMIEIAIEKAKQKGTGNIIFSIGDSGSMGFAPSSFDAIIVANLLHLLPKPDGFLTSIANLLKDDGIMIAPTFLHNYNPQTIELSNYMQQNGHPIGSRFCSDSLVATIEKAGYIIHKATILESVMPMMYVSAKKCKKKPF